MPKRIYQVSYEEKYSGVGGWMPDKKNVLADGDSLVAFRKLKRHILGTVFEDDRGQIHRCQKVRLVGIEVVAEADF